MPYSIPARLLLIILICFAGVRTQAQAWFGLGSGTDNFIHALAVYNGELYAAGDFTHAGGNPANGIARWNGARWDSVGSGIDGHIHALCVYNNELYAGGDFLHAGGNSAPRIAKWNGTSWSPVGTGMSNWVYALTVYNNMLVAGGYFISAGGVPANYIASWNGTHWDSLGAGVFGTHPTVKSLTVYNSKLIAGGGFTQAGTQPATFIAQWDGTSWSPVGTGNTVSALPNPEVLTLAVYNNELYAGGGFDTICNVPALYLAKWNGTTWSTVGSGVNGQPGAFLMFNSQLYMCGGFTAPPLNVASWNGTSWSGLGSGVSSWAYAMAVYNNNLYVGGSFTSAGGNPVGYIAEWSSDTGLAPGLGKQVPELYPNPGTGTMFLKISSTDLPARMEVYNSLGQKVLDSPVLSATSSLDINHQARGIYFYKIYSGTRLLREDKFVLQ